MASVGRKVKEAIVEELSTKLSKRPNVLVTAMNRLQAPETDALREKLYASHAQLIMGSRRLLRRAIEPLNVAGLKELLEGSVGLVVTGEEAQPAAKIIVEFRRAHEEQVSVKGGLIDGHLLDGGTVEQLASLPPKPALLAHVVATIESPIAEVIMMIERLIGDLVWIAEQAAATKPLSTGVPETGATNQT
ncbi:MAG: 50S ribosomal protein L10 [Candidatus Omnitrophica bacterium]|nr:50S ribosomal protein L10 [Candidatus Omnitrophota bacterium]MBI3021592.1 50S ribosomal protein L10 [Candidatus Omnitrophota bacterium]MBI3083807.1 50S ribosomal protein L10 [Candidatus Omnitrophota bacterium]